MKRSLVTILYISLIFSLFSQTAGNTGINSLVRQNASSASALNPSSASAATTASSATTASALASSFENYEFSAQIAMTDANYQVTAGDVYLLSFSAGGNAVSYPMIVDTSYKIRVANLAVLDVKGKTFPLLKKQVEEIVMRNYPMSGVQFVLQKPSVFFVTISGEVNKTVEKRCWSLTRLSSILEGCFTNYSSNRRIEIKSSDGSVHTYDLFMAERFGDLSQDPYLRPGDIVRIPRVSRKVTINGDIERPGTYDLLEGENLKKLIEFYGNGVRETADLSRIELFRLIDNDSKDNLGRIIYLTSKDIEKDLPLFMFDTVTVSSYRDLNNVAFIEGAIKVSADINLEASNQVPVKISEGLRYSSFVRQNKSLFSEVSDLQNAYIVRGDQKIQINLIPYLYNPDYYSDLTVEPYDVLRIPFRQFFVTVSGAVHTPGRYPFIPDRTYEYYVAMAGGFDKSKNRGDSVVITDIQGKKLKKDTIITPECNIRAKSNSFGYYFSQYSPIATTLLSIISTILSVRVLIKS